MATTKEVIINGKKYAVSFNASKELSQPVEGLKDEVLINMPRMRTWNGFRPVVKLGEEEVTLGFHFYTEEEKAAYKNYDKAHRSGGSGTSSKSKEVRADLIAFRDTLKGAAKAELTAIIDKYFPDEAIAKAKNALSGLSKEQLAAIIAAMNA